MPNPQDAQNPPLTIDVVSDVVCPWCFIGKRRLEKALALKPNIPVEVRFHPYFLNPWVPREGMTPGSLSGIPGAVPGVASYPKGCRFHPRCPLCMPRCLEIVPALERLPGGAEVACHEVSLAEAAHG